MSHTVLTLICNPQAPALSDDRAADVSAFLADHEFGPARRVILAEGIAEDYVLDGAFDAQDLEIAARAQLGDVPIDIVVQPAENRRKKLLIADMDSTIIEQECIDELAEFAGLRAEISAITERAMRGELDFDGALTERVAMLKGLPESTLEEAFETRISLTPGAKTLVQTMNMRGAYTALVSGGFTFFTERVAAAAGFQVNQANTLILENGALTGAVGAPILGRAAKEEALLRLCKDQTIAPEETLAVGDGANDLSMLGAAGLGVAFRAKPAVAEAADASIRHGDLSALLYLQGFPSAEHVV